MLPRSLRGWPTSLFLFSSLLLFSQPTFLSLPIYFYVSLSISLIITPSSILFSFTRLPSHCFRSTPSFPQFNSLLKNIPFYRSTVSSHLHPHHSHLIPSSLSLKTHVIPPFVPSASISLSLSPHVTSPVGVTFTGSVTRADAMPCPFSNCSWASPLIPLPFSSARLPYSAFCAPDPPKWILIGISSISESWLGFQLPPFWRRHTHVISARGSGRSASQVPNDIWKKAREKEKDRAKERGSENKSFSSTTILTAVWLIAFQLCSSWPFPFPPSPLFPPYRCCIYNCKSFTSYKEFRSSCSFLSMHKHTRKENIHTSITRLSMNTKGSWDLLIHLQLNVKVSKSL